MKEWKAVFVWVSVVIAVLAMFAVNGVNTSKIESMAADMTWLSDRLADQAEGKAAYREKIIEWVYARSERISRATVEQIVDECFRYDFPILLLAIIASESNFIPTAVSHVGAKGLGQIMWKVHGKMLSERGIAKNERDLFDISKNIQATYTVFTSMLADAKGDASKALRMYVGGTVPRYHNEVLSNFLTLSLIK